jgi:hypothetical protein
MTCNPGVISAHVYSTALAGRLYIGNSQARNSGMTRAHVAGS